MFTGHLIYMSFLQTVPPLLILAIGLTFVVTAGEIDLSFPAVVAFAGFVFTWFFKNLTTSRGSASCSLSSPGRWSATSMACSWQGAACPRSW